MSRISTDLTRKRPRGRKDDLARVAGALFYERGYDQVGIDDVAAVVGITGGAVYRHYKNKAKLLARVFDDQLSLVESALEPAPEGSTPQPQLARVLDRLVAVAPDTRPLGTLVNRDARHLEEADQLALLARVERLLDRLAVPIAATRPELTSTEARVLARSLLAVFGSHSFHVVPVPWPRAAELLREMMATLVATTAHLRPGAAPAPEDDVSDDLSGLRSSRREQLLDTAITLFGRHGYASVRLEDIGAAAGLTGPAIYQYFDSKADLLVAALKRGEEWLTIGVSSAFATSASPRQALARIVSSYVRFLLEYPELITLLVSEAPHLSADQRTALQRPVDDYARQWAALLAAVRPDLDERDALFVSWCVLTTVNDGARTLRIRDRNRAQQILTNFACELLQLEGENVS